MKFSAFSIVVYAGGIVVVLSRVHEAGHALGVWIVLLVWFAHRLAFEIARAAYRRRDPTGTKSKPGPWLTWLYVTKPLGTGLAALLAPLVVIARYPNRATIAFGSIFAFVGLIGTIGGIELVRGWRRDLREQGPARVPLPSDDSSAASR
ncbi:MAG TPA: hypothetical protein VHC45_14680 [Gaiellaceae bacterium]|nr:hypothetical protein [Gaiellaceae bacterium]